MILKHSYFLGKFLERGCGGLMESDVIKGRGVVVTEEEEGLETQIRDDAPICGILFFKLARLIVNGA